MRIKTVLTILLFSLLIINSPVISGKSKSVIDSKHNLSTSGPGEIKSTTETRVCIFCHSSHNTSSEGPLWNHKTTSSGKFITYSRSTINSQPEQPNGATKLCLSCHDGTIAVGALHNSNFSIPMRNVAAGGEIPTNKKSNLGKDLSGSHPVSIKYNQKLSFASKHLQWPPFDVEEKVGVDADGYVQCTACHDPHNDSKSEKYPFWNKTTFSDVCKVCHNY